MSLAIKREQMLLAPEKNTKVAQVTPSTGGNLVKNVVAIVKESCEREDFSQIGEQLRTLKLSSPQITKENIKALIIHVKEVAPELDLPIVYRHLIQDLQLGADGNYLALANLSPKDEAFRIECAFLAAETQLKEFLTTVHRYCIRDQAALFSLAKMVGIQCGYFLSFFVDQFGIKEDKNLFAIAKLVQDQCTDKTPFEIERFPIKDEALRVELAKREAKHNLSNLLKNMHKYQITSEEARTEIAKIAANQNGVDTLDAIEQFSIADLMRRLDVLLVALKQNKASMQHLGKCKLGLVEKALLFSRFATRLDGVAGLPIILLHFICEKNVTDRDKILENFPEILGFGFPGNLTQCVMDLWEVEGIPFSELRPLYTRSRELALEQDPAVETRNSALLSLEISAWRFTYGCPALLKTLLVEIEKVKGEENPAAFTQRTRAILSVLLDCRALKIDKNTLAQHADILTAILDIRSRELRDCLLPRFMDGLVTSPKPVKFPSKASAITAVLLSPLMTNVKVSMDFIERVNKAMHLKPFRKDDSKCKSLLQNLNALVETHNLSAQEKIDILNTLIFFKSHETADKQAKRIYESAQLIAQFVSIGKEQILTACENFDDLLSGVKDLYKERLGVTIDMAAWAEIIGKWRRPQSLLTYANTLSQLPSPDRENLLELLRKFTLSVLQGRFKEVRYDVDPTWEHMEKLRSKGSNLLEAWKKGSVLAREEHLVVDTDDPCDLLLAGTEVGSCQSVDADPKYSKCLISYLLDPKIRMLAIKNKAGVIVARSMLRLLWDPKNQRIVLYQAANYCNGNPAFSEKLDTACLKRAQELSIPLYRSMENPGGSVLLSFKGGVPYEYVDGTEDSVKKDGSYYIINCTCCYNT